MARLPAGHRRGALRRPARWTRSTGPTTSSSRSEAARTLPSVVPLVGPELGDTNIVPVDYVADGDGPHRPRAGARRAGLPPRRPEGPRGRDGAQRVRRGGRTRRGCRCASTSSSLGRCPGVLGACSMQLPPLRDVRATMPRPARDPAGGARRTSPSPHVRHARHRRALAGTGIEVPALEAVRATCCGTTGSSTSTPTAPRPLVRGRPVDGRTGRDHGGLVAASARPPRCKVAAAGGVPLLVARRRRSSRRWRPRSSGPAARRGSTPCDLTDAEAVDDARRATAGRPRARRHAREQRGPLDPALDQAVLRPLPRLRAHDGAQLLRRGPADPRAAAAHDASAGSATSSTCRRSACRRTRRASPPTWRRRRRSTRSGASCPPRPSATTSPSPRSTCRSCARR